ncbi:hypothetical protein SDC9_142441 [bioreactor metagenome]|uniref:Uncharacterized protein n=1 Tax=bioreactor metagenome TaxID=1076179 RepID=A0A645E0U0_9ZZZZ
MVVNAQWGFHSVVSKTISFQIGVDINPFQGLIHIAFQLLDHFDIPGPVHIFGQEDQEQWCSIDSTVVRCLWDQVQVSQFAQSQFVKNFTGLLVPPII